MRFTKINARKAYAMSTKTEQSGLASHLVFLAQPEKLDHPVWKIGLSSFFR
jgi:hypothetical protein